MCHVYGCNKFPPSDINFGLFQLFHHRPTPRVHHPPKTHVNGRPPQFQSSRQHHRCTPQNGNGMEWIVIQGKGKRRRRREATNILSSSFHVVLSRNSSSGTYHPVTLITKPIPVHHPHKPFVYYFRSLGALPIIAFHISNAPAELIAILRGRTGVQCVCMSGWDVGLNCGELLHCVDTGNP